MRYAAALAALVALCGCNSDLEGDLLHIAVGAEVTLELDPVSGVFQPHTCDRPAGVGCLAFPARRLVEVELDEDDGIFELVGSRQVGDSVHVTVRALKEGEAQLEVSFVNAQGDDIDQGFVLNAEAITRVEVEPTSCESDDARAPFLVTPGSALGIRSSLGANTRLAHDGVDLIDDLDGFTIEEGDTQSGVLRAPDEPGTYLIRPKGHNSQPLEVVVYDPSDLEVELKGGPGQIVLERQIDRREVCVHDDDTPAVVEVTNGTCAPYVNGFDILGPMPVSTRGHDPVVQIGGEANAPCRIAVSVGGEVVDEASVTASPLVGDDDRVTPSGDPIGLTGQAFGGTLAWRDACPDVSAPSGFAPFSWEAFLSEHDILGTNGSFGYVGVGLDVELWTTEVYELETGVQRVPPIDVSYRFEPVTGIVFEESGCVGGEYRILALRPEVEEDFLLQINKQNGPSFEQFTVRAREVDHGTFTTDAPEDTVQWFVNTPTLIDIDFRDADDNPLYGTSPIYIRSDVEDAGARYDNGILFTGNIPHTLELSSFAIGDIKLIQVVDETAITSLSGLGSATVDRGEANCIAVQARGQDDEVIFGKGPVRPALTLSGDGLLVDLTESDDLCLVGGTPGSTDVQVTWGAASDTQRWTTL